MSVTNRCVPSFWVMTHSRSEERAEQQSSANNDGHSNIFCDWGGWECVCVCVCVGGVGSELYFMEIALLYGYK